MKILICGDVHLCEMSSIVRATGEKYTKRLDNIIKSINWVEKTATNNNVQMVVYLGDFFDKPSLTAMEITSLNDINWASNIQHYFLVGNHDSNIINLKYSSAEVLRKYGIVVNKPTYYNDNYNPLVFIPYIKSEDVLKLEDIVGDLPEKPIVFAHQDIAGLQYGGYTSKSGFSIDEINEVCKYFIDGHLHNGLCENDKLLIVGNLTGSGFTEDATRYRHNVYILDTDKDEFTKIENPHAMNFYKLSGIKNLPEFNENSVVSLSVEEKDEEVAKELVKGCLASRVSITYNENYEDSENSLSADDLKVEDHIKLFIEYALSTLPDTYELHEELMLLGGRDNDSEVQ